MERKPYTITNESEEGIHVPGVGHVVPGTSNVQLSTEEARAVKSAGIKVTRRGKEE